MLASLADLKSFLGISTTDNDTLLTEILEYVDQYVKTYTGRSFEEAAVSNEIFNTNGLKRIFAVKEPPIKESPTPTVTYDGVAVSTDDYEILYDEGLFVFDSPPARAVKKLLISYTGGYATIPADLQLATIKISAGIFKNRKSTSGATSKKLGDFSINYGESGDSDLDAVIQNNLSILDMYRRITV
jgi:hypothetical protein